MGENPKMPYPQCGRSIKTYARGNNNAASITEHGSPVRLDTQIVALRLQCVRTALKAPPRSVSFESPGKNGKINKLPQGRQGQKQQLSPIENLFPSGFD